MKKCVIALVLCSSSFAMNNYEARIGNLESKMAAIENIMNDKTDPDDPSAKILGLKSKVEKNTTAVNLFNQSILGLSTGISSFSTTVSSLIEQVSDIKLTLTNLETKFNKELECAWTVIDIITACKIKGDPVPTYIKETAAQIQKNDFKTRRTALADILNKLNIFISLLDGEKINLIQKYLDDTNVPDPNIREINEILPIANIIIDGNYIKITGVLRTFIRGTYLGSGLPHESWMDINYDYFSFKRSEEIKGQIKKENEQRTKDNKEIEQKNAEAQTKYEDEIWRVSRIPFPAEELDALITDYNRLLTRHEI